MRARLVRSALLFGYALLVAKLFLAGEMVKYMTPALDPLTALTGLVLAVMAVVELVGGAGGAGAGAPALERRLTDLLVLLPLVLGLAVTPRGLGSSAIGGETVERLLLTYAPGAATPAGSAAAMPGRTVEDVGDLLAYLREVGEAGVGVRVRATGLVARGDALAAGEFALLRFAIAHCVADARPLALLVAAGGAAAGLPPDQWVEVEGVVAARERGGDRLVAIVADRVRPIEEPSNPYLSAAY
jgi:uncharacterized repeat protein (TIGR03943 family)